MSSVKTSGQDPFAFALREDLYTLPATAQEHEVDLHGGFAVDARYGYGQIYYGMPGCGIMRIDADLRRQDIIGLPDDLTPLNFHGTQLGEIDGNRRLFLPANNDELVVVLTLDGDVDFTLPRPELDEYRSEEVPYKPTDTVLMGRPPLRRRRLRRQLHPLGRRAHAAVDRHLRWQDRRPRGGRQVRDGPRHQRQSDAQPAGHRRSPSLAYPGPRGGGRVSLLAQAPVGAFLCGISYLDYEDRWYAVIGCLRDPVEDRPAPIYIIDAESYELLSTVRPKEELGVDLAQHLHNVALHIHDGQVYLVCQAWNPGHYFVLQRV